MVRHGLSTILFDYISIGKIAKNLKDLCNECKNAKGHIAREDVREQKKLKAKLEETVAVVITLANERGAAEKIRWTALKRKCLLDNMLKQMSDVCWAYESWKPLWGFCLSKLALNDIS